MASTLTAGPVKARLRPLYVTGFIHGFALWYAVEKLFMKSIGFSDFLITVVTITYIVVMTAANLPLGVLADRWSRKGVLYVATGALIGGTLICGLARGFWMYAAGLSVWGVFYACYAGTYDSVIYDVVLEETGTAGSFEHWLGRVQMYDSAAFITGALASAAVAGFAGLRAEFFLTIPVTCAAFFTLSRFREPSLHKTAGRARLTAHLGQLRTAMTASPAVAWIAAALVCNLLAMRLIFEFMQLWYLGLALPAALFGPSFALVYGGAWTGGSLAGKPVRPAADPGVRVPSLARPYSLGRPPLVSPPAVLGSLSCLPAPHCQCAHGTSRPHRHPARHRHRPHRHKPPPGITLGTASGTTLATTITTITGTTPAVSGSWSSRRAACRWRRAGQELSARGCRPRRSGRRAGRR